MFYRFSLMVAIFLSSLASASPVYVSFILDRSPSMKQTRPYDGQTRCEASKKLVLDTVRRQFKSFGSDLNVEIYLFGGTGSSATNGFINDEKRVIEILEGIGDNDCNIGGTALADALCSNADMLRSQYQKQRGTLMVFGATDGEENRSKICDDKPDLSWQDQVRARFVDGPKIIFNPLIFKPGGTSSFRSSFNEEGVTERSINKTFEFLIALAKETGGEATTIEDTAAIPSLPLAPFNLESKNQIIKQSYDVCKLVLTSALTPYDGVKIEESTSDEGVQSIRFSYEGASCQLALQCQEIPYATISSFTLAKSCLRGQSLGAIEKDLDLYLKENFSSF